MAADLLPTALVGAVAWLTGKAWELQQSRRLRYADLAGLLAAWRTTDRAVLVANLSRLSVEAPTTVVRSAQEVVRMLARDVAGVESDKDHQLVLALIIAMRRDTTLWAWFDSRRWHRAQVADIDPR